MQFTKINSLKVLLTFLLVFIPATSFSADSGILAIYAPSGGEYEVGGKISITLNVTKQGEESLLQVLLFPSIAKIQGGISPLVLVQSLSARQFLLQNSFPLPLSVDPGEYFVRVLCVASCVPDSSFIDSGTFKIIQKIPEFIRGLTLSGGQELSVGKFYDIGWESSSKLFIVKAIGASQENSSFGAWITDQSDSFRDYSSTLENKKKYSWFIDDDRTPPGKYRIRIEALDSTTYKTTLSAESDVFTIVANPGTTFPITPNGGEVWEVGKTYRISWPAMLAFSNLIKEGVKSISVAFFYDDWGDFSKSQFITTVNPVDFTKGFTDFTVNRDFFNADSLRPFVEQKYRVAVGFNCTGIFTILDTMKKGCPFFGSSYGTVTIVESPLNQVNAPPPIVFQPKIPQTTTPSQQNLSTTVQLRGPFAVGMTSDEVKKLQEMMSKDPTIYQGETTGYYGAKTIEGVQRFQKKYNIITSGTPDTTGFGLAGPGTRTKLNEIFGSSIILTTSTPPTVEALQKQLSELLALVAELQKKLAILRGQ